MYKKIDCIYNCGNFESVYVIVIAASNYILVECLSGTRVDCLGAVGQGLDGDDHASHNCWSRHHSTGDCHPAGGNHFIGAYESRLMQAKCSVTRLDRMRDRKSTRLNSSHSAKSRMPSSA